MELHLLKEFFLVYFEDVYSIKKIERQLMDEKSLFQMRKDLNL
ncbi:unnamed protein product [marine sediment metagenome]|uniref:Uncharacterized protein n=1 Tax=marine sediment metagenome TaxID=412755 RepID=X1TCC9_9ZZZZ